MNSKILALFLWTLSGCFPPVPFSSSSPPPEKTAEDNKDYRPWPSWTRSKHRRARRRSSSANAGAIAGFCDRTEGVRDAVLAPLQNAGCSEVTQTQLDQITELVVTLSPRPALSGTCGGRSSLKSGDFAGLKKLKKIQFGGRNRMGCLQSVPEDIFSGLSNLEEIHFGQQNHFRDLPENVFRNLNKLKKISLPECFDENDDSLQGLGSGVEIVADC